VVSLRYTCEAPAPAIIRASRCCSTIAGLTLLKARTADYPATFHIGFIQPTEAAVDALHARSAVGFAADPPARAHAWTFYVKATGGVVVEVLA
jgi:hypothetical protein